MNRPGFTLHTLSLNRHRLNDLTKSAETAQENAGYTPKMLKVAAQTALRRNEQHMTQIKPVELASRLGEETDEFVRVTVDFKRYDRSKFEKLMLDAEALANFDAATASQAKAALCSAINDLPQMERWLKNLINLRHPEFEREVRFFHYVHHTYAKLAMELAPKIMAEPGGRPLTKIAEMIAGSGGYQMARKLIDDSVANKMVLVDNGGIQFLRQAADVLLELEVSDHEMIAMADICGEVLRAHELTWLDRQPRVVPGIYNEDGKPHFSMEYRVTVSPEEAAEMTWDLTERLLKTGIARDNVFMGFLGLGVVQLEPA